MRYRSTPLTWHQNRLFVPTAPAINLEVTLQLSDSVDVARAFWAMSDPALDDGLLLSDGNHPLNVTTNDEWLEYCAHALTLAQKSLGPFG